MSNLTRRQLITAAGVTTFAGLPAAPAPVKSPFLISLNTSTLMGHKLPITKTVEIAAKAGFNAIEPWIRELDDHVKSGGSLSDLKKQIDDLGLKVISSIGFFDWIVDDDRRRATALEEARRNMELVQKIGGLRLAAPPSGATDQADLNLMRAAERYHALLEIGDKFGVVPQAEIWGFSKCLNNLGSATMVALESHHPNACILPDVFHLHKGGSDFGAILKLNKSLFHNFHVNDYPAAIPVDKVTDADRVYPGDGGAPLVQLLRDLKTIGYEGALSLELFNRDLWKADPLEVAVNGVKKIKALIAKAA
ncbi:MAG: sugar phosphate isomerase/epimerase, partial [Chthonomonadales bacterium]